MSIECSAGRRCWHIVCVHNKLLELIALVGVVLDLAGVYVERDLCGLERPCMNILKGRSVDKVSTMT